MKYSPVVCFGRRRRAFLQFWLFWRVCAFTTGEEEESCINMQVQKKLLDKQPISHSQQNGSGQEYNSEINEWDHVKLQPCSLSEGLISTAKSLRCVEGKQGWGLSECANMQTSDSRAHIVAGMNKKAITVFSGLALTQSRHAY